MQTTFDKEAGPSATAPDVPGDDHEEPMPNAPPLGHLTHVDNPAFEHK